MTDEVKFHPDYTNMLHKWNLITLMSSGDIRRYPTTATTGTTSTLDGQPIGYTGDLSNWSAYLYLPDVTNPSPEAIQRRNDFVKGSVLFPATSRTINGSIGTVFRKPSDIELAPSLRYLEDNADGNGLPLEQSMQEAYKYAFSKGRCGLFVDYTSDGEPVTAGAINSRKAGANILIYQPESIVNWHASRHGAVNRLDMICLAETYTKQNSLYDYECCVRYRTLYIDGDGFYAVNVCCPNDDAIEDVTFTPTKSDGARFDTIQFFFIGSDNNDYKIDDAPMYPIAEQNKQHLGFSAVRTESINTLSPTAIIGTGDGFNHEDFAKANPKGIQLGQNKAYVGEFSMFDLIQAEPNDAATVEMQKLKEGMIESGALLITPQSSNISTDTAEIQQGVDTTTIAIVGRNVESAYNQALASASMFMGESGDSEVSINRDYFDTSMSAQDRQAWANDVMMGNVTREEYRTALINDGLLSETADAAIDGLPVMDDDDLDV